MAKPMPSLPKTYGELVAALPPRPIHDALDLANASEMIDRLAGFDLNADQEDYLEALSVFVEAYEADHFPIDDSDITPLDAANGMTALPAQADA
jgi:antitoxin component HigA of HigAB toxin-antitoxin module